MKNGTEIMIDSIMKSKPKNSWLTIDFYDDIIISQVIETTEGCIVHASSSGDILNECLDSLITQLKEE